MTKVVMNASRFSLALRDRHLSSICSVTSFRSHVIADRLVPSAHRFYLAKLSMTAQFYLTKNQRGPGVRYFPVRSPLQRWICAAQSPTSGIPSLVRLSCQINTLIFIFSTVFSFILMCRPTGGSGDTMNLWNRRFWKQIQKPEKI